VLARLTRGAFDPTIEPLNRAWKMRGKGKLPSAFDLDRARMLVGWRKLSLDPAGRRAFLSFSGMGVDLRGVGKGYSLDRAARLLRKAGIERAFLDLGGRALAIGDSCDAVVAHPGEPQEPLARLRISNGAISTASQAERGVTIKRKRYGHIFDPRTGVPVEESGSVTVIAPSGTRADALSTALLVMGRERAAAFVAEHPELGALWLEPTEGGVRAWRWNFPDVAAVDGTGIEWMDDIVEPAAKDQTDSD
jgi:thiamine biosynthesis lipoprotein